MSTYTKRGVVIDSTWSRNRREGYYIFKMTGLMRKGKGPKFNRGASRIDSLCKFRTAGGLIMTIDADAVITINGRQLDPVQAGALRKTLDMARGETQRRLTLLNMDNELLPIISGQIDTARELLENIRLIERFVNTVESDHVEYEGGAHPRIIIGRRVLTYDEVDMVGTILSLHAEDDAVYMRLSNHLDFIDS